MVVESIAYREFADMFLDYFALAILVIVGECKKICVTGILTTLLKGQQNAIIRRTH